MNDLVGIIRTGAEMQQALDKIEEFKVRFRNIESDGSRAFNPGWHLAMDMRNMLLVSECVARSGLARTESRGGHTRDDYPAMAPDWRRALVVCRTEGDDPVMPTVISHPRGSAADAGGSAGAVRDRGTREVLHR